MKSKKQAVQKKVSAPQKKSLSPPQQSQQVTQVQQQIPQLQQITPVQQQQQLPQKMVSKKGKKMQNNFEDESQQVFQVQQQIPQLQQITPVQQQQQQFPQKMVSKNRVILDQNFGDDEISQLLIQKSQLVQKGDQVELINPIQQQNNNSMVQIQQQQKEQVKGSNKNLNDQIQISLQSLTKAIKLSSKESQVLPVQAQVNTQDSDMVLDLNKRPNIDLICVIDVSGSMMGEKIQLVKDTLIQLGDYLNENDRICLIPFSDVAERATKLLTYSKQNKEVFEKAILSLEAGGGTDITKGMDLAYKTIKDRKMANDVTSIFLLSDGQDGNGLNGVKQLEKKYNIQSSFSINCFGFGNDHDPVLMSGVAKVGDGSFYFIERLDLVDELFVDALGGLFSVLVQNVEIKIQVVSSNKHFSNVSFVKTYGTQWIYDKVNKNYKIEMKQLIGGVTKEFLFDINIPPINVQLSDHERNASFIEMTLKAQNLEGQQTINKQTFLQLTIYNENEEIVPEINEEVQINVIRIQGAEAMSQIKEKADQGLFEEGQKIIESFQTKIQKLKPQQQKKLELLSKDFGDIKVSCSNKQQYQQFGNIQIISTTKQHMEKRSKGAPLRDDMDSYQNSVQKLMVTQQKSKKKM